MTFLPTSRAWESRSADPNDVLFAQIVRTSGDARVGLFGVPLDEAVIGRKGTREGPAAIREHLARLKPGTVDGGELSFSVRDWGDVVLPAGDVPKAHEAVRAGAAEIVAAGQLPLALGGDHSITFPLVQALGDRRLGVINLDAHLDVRDVVDGKLNSGQSFGRLIEHGLVRGQNLAEVGLRDFANAPRYVEKARKAGATLISADAWRSQGLAAIDRAIDVASEGTAGVYLSIDIDVLDQSEAPGVSAPTAGGVSTAHLLQAVRRIASRANLAGVDVVETAPALDRDHMTSRAAAYVVMHALAGLHERRR